MTHTHTFTLHFSDTETRPESVVSKTSGGRQFVVEQIPVCTRQCECGYIEQLRAGTWRTTEKGKKYE
jgi:hypothetical protein